MITVTRISRREAERRYGFGAALGYLQAVCDEHGVYAFVPMPPSRGRLPMAVQRVLTERLLRTHRESGDCTCEVAS